MTSPGDSQPPKDWWLENACRIAAFRLRQAKYLSANTAKLQGQVRDSVLPSAKTEVSHDGNALVVHRFDVNGQGHPLWGMEDFCALLGLRPAAKYETTWERIARAVRDHVPGSRQYESFYRLAATLWLMYAVRNADCHANNLALLYTAGDDVHLSPAYDFLTTTVYASYLYNPPGIGLMEKKTWNSGQTLPRFIAGKFGIPLRKQALLVEAIIDAVSDVAPFVQEKMAEHPTSETSGNGCCSHGSKGCMAFAKSGSMPVESGRETDYSGVFRTPQTRHTVHYHRPFTADG